MFNNNTIKSMMDHAREEYPRESCGLVINGYYRKFKNVSADPEEEFKISDREWAHVRIHNNIQAVVHSHPDGPDYPSEADQRKQISMSDIPWGIIVVKQYQIEAPFFWGDSLPVVPLEGRHWRIGVHDCYGLVRDWYRLNKNIKLPNRPRKDDWWHDLEQKDFLLRWYQKDGWVDVPDRFENLIEGDVFLINFPDVSPIPTHCAVYIGKGLALHHRWDRLSSKIPVAPFQHMIQRVVRYSPNDPA